MQRDTLRLDRMSHVRRCVPSSRVALSLIGLVLSVLLIPRVVYPQDSPDPIPSQGLTKPINLDLQTDPRSAFRVDGPVGWEPGKLTLQPGASVHKALDVGAQVKLTLRLAFTPLTRDGQTSTTRVAFEIRDRGAFVAQVLRRRERGKTLGQIELIEEETPVNLRDRQEKRTRSLRSFEWNGELPDEPWTFRLHYGLLTVHVGTRRLAIGYTDKDPGQRFSGPERFTPPDKVFFRLFGIGKPLEVSAWDLTQQGEAVGCLQISGSASVAGDAEKKALAQARIDVVKFADPRLPDAIDLRGLIDQPSQAVHQRLSPLAKPDDIGPRPPHSEDSDFRRILANLGDRHPCYALALTGWAMQYHWAGKDPIAEKLLEEAVAKSAASLGPLHPDHALIISSLGHVYRDLGKFDGARPLWNQALEITNDVFGPRSDRTSASLRQFAVLQQDFGRFAEAETLLRRAVDASAPGPPAVHGDALTALGQLFARMGEHDKADALLLEADNLLEADLRNRFRETAQLKELAPVILGVGNVKVQRGWLLFQDGKKDPARQLARSALLQLSEFQHQDGSRARFDGWNNPMMNIQPHQGLQNDPRYPHVVLDLARLFASLGDKHPAYGCIQILDLVPLHSHHDLAAIYRIMSQVHEAHSNSLRGFVTSYTSGVSERWRREAVYLTWDKSRKHQQNPNERRPEPDVYWLDVALEELEQSVGRVHPDTLDALSARARQQWLYNGPEEAEPVLRDAVGRAVDLAGKVLPGLPEVQTYQFLEANRPPVDLMLSLYRATKTDHARAAYEAVWQSKALATRQLVERRQLARAASGEPEIARLAQELDTTRRSLARVALAPPAGNSLEPRREQMAELTGRKEDLERELARRSEPFRRTRDADRATITELVRRLPPQTAVVDLTERWDWSPPPPDPAVVRQRPSATSASPPEAAEPARRSFAVVPGMTRAQVLENARAATRMLQDAQASGPAPRSPTAPPKKAVPDQKKGGADPYPPRREDPPSPRGSKPWARKRGYDAFVLRPEIGEPGWKAIWLDLGDADSLDRLLDGWIASVRPGGQVDQALAHQVRERLWKPIDAALGDCRTVILIPDGRLAQVPWNALPGRRPDSYLIEDYALAQAPYGQYVARMLTGPAQAGDGFLLVGGIDYGPPGKWSYLSGTAVEVEQLAELRPGPDTARLVGPAATQAALRELMPGRRFIHLATHGEFLDSRPGLGAGLFQVPESSVGGVLFDFTARNPLVLSKLVLAGANRPVATDAAGLPVGDDGFLTAEEVIEMDLSRTELVVLSACETGAGKVRGHEGVFSLQRAFHVAGSRAVIASLWSVDDRATQALMGRFYQNLWAKEGKAMGKLQALREAQVWLLRHGAEELGRTRGGLSRPGDPKTSGQLPPSYWAAFVLSGDWL